MKQTVTGNIVILKLRGTPVGAGVQGVNMQDSYGLQDVDGLGQSESYEIVPGKTTYTITLSKYFVSGKTLEELGFVPNADTLLTSGDLEIEVLDRLNSRTLELYTGCKADTHSRNYDKHVISGEQATFRALHKST